MELRKTITAAILTVFVIFLLCMGRGVQIMPASASAAENSSVMYDLWKDGNFDESKYPHDPKDNSLQVIQVAEGSGERLYLYVYQPSAATRELTATKINMALSEDVSGTKLYGLDLLSRSGVFAKYLVRGVTVSSEATRYYNITSIYRKWDKDIDKDTGNNNTIDEKVFPVRNVYKVTTENGVKKYSRNPTYVVNIVNPYVDYLIYTTYDNTTLPKPPSSIIAGSGKSDIIDGHYIAFSTDWDIDRLLSATVHYERCSGHGYYNEFLWFDCGGNVEYGQSSEDYAYPTYKDKVEFKGGILAPTYTYSWDRIQTVSEFIAGERYLTEETKKNLEGKQWVLRFLETERTQRESNVLGYKHYESYWTKVDKVAVLRLEFETCGVVYNLGTVSDIQSGDEFAGNVDVITKVGLTPLIVGLVIIGVSVGLLILCSVVNKKVGERTMTIIGSFLAALIAAVLRVIAGVYADGYKWVSACVLPLNIVCGILAGVFALFVVIEVVQAIRGRQKNSNHI